MTTESKGHVHALRNGLTQSLVHMLEDLALLPADIHITSLAHMPDSIVDQVILVLFRKAIPLWRQNIVNTAQGTVQ
jgi:hypothetical protein